MSVPAAYLGVVLIWSTTPLAILWSSQGVGFLFGVTARMSVAVVLCAALVKLLRVSFPWDAEARRAYLASGLGLYGAMMFVYWGAQFISSGLVSVVYGMMPLMTTLIVVLVLRQGRLSWARLGGIGLGICGLVVIYDPRLESSAATLLGVGAVLVSTVLHAFSMLGVQRWGHHVPPLAVTAGGLGVAVPLYLLSWALFGGAWPAQLSDKNIAAILYLASMGSVVGFVLFYYTLKKISADVVALATLITPVCALLIGHFFNGEALELKIVLGAALILTGLALHHWGELLFQRRRR